MKMSVVIPTHNRSALLRQAIESVLEQELDEIEVEVIVVDDDSTDDTAAVVAAYPSVRYVHTRQGQAGGSRNVGIACAQGEWVAFLDDDDVWLPHKLAACRRLIRDNPDARFVYSAATICDHELHPTGGVWIGPDLTRGRTTLDAFLAAVISASVVVMRRELFAEFGGFDTSIPRAEDLDVWLRVAAAGVQCAATTEPLVLYRQRERRDGDLDYKSYRDTMTVLRRYFARDSKSRPSWRRRQQTYLHYRGWYAYRLVVAAREARREGRRAQALRLLRTAFGISPVHAAKTLLTSP